MKKKAYQREPRSSGYGKTHSCSKGRGFESLHHILNGYFYHILVFVIQFVMFVSKD